MLFLDHIMIYLICISCHKTVKYMAKNSVIPWPWQLPNWGFMFFSCSSAQCISLCHTSYQPSPWNGRGSSWCFWCALCVCLHQRVVVSSLEHFSILL